MRRTSQKRKSLQKEIAKLNVQREAYFAKENAGRKNRLSAVLIETLRSAGTRVDISGI